MRRQNVSFCRFNKHADVCCYLIDEEVAYPKKVFYKFGEINYEKCHTYIYIYIYIPKN